MEESRAKFLNAYANVPSNFRKDVIAIIDKQPYSWETAYFEVREKTKIGEKILNKLKEIKLI